MDLEDRNSLSDECDYDSVAVYDGDSQTDTLLGRWCGREQPSSLVSKGNKLLVVLSTDRNEAHRGFTASYLGGKWVFFVFWGGRGGVCEDIIIIHIYNLYVINSSKDEFPSKLSQTFNPSECMLSSAIKCCKYSTNHKCSAASPHHKVPVRGAQAFGG